MKFYVGVTDYDWFYHLYRFKGVPEDINFWQPGGNQQFKVIKPGAPFLFKLKAPHNAIGGVGFFISSSLLPLTLAWDTFGERNGCNSLSEFRNKILTYRRNHGEINPTIGNIVLTNPIFFKENDWIPTPRDWGKSIVQGKSYSTVEGEGVSLWTAVMDRLERYSLRVNPPEMQSPIIITDQLNQPNEYNEVLSRVRVGQGAFRVQIIESYNRRCAISGEKTLPALEASHIRPYSENGPHQIPNGILLRSDIHNLFDAGYITITPDYKIEVSRRIKEEFENGRDYYKFHGQNLIILPEQESNRPGPEFIEWHNNMYNGVIR